MGLRMEKSYEIKENGITLRTAIPLLAITGMKIAVSENEHGKGELEAVVRKEYAADVLRMDFGGTGILVEGEKGEVIFNGFLEKAEFCIESGYTGIKAEFISWSALLDRERKSRSFQNPEITYGQAAGEVFKGYQDGVLLWKAGQGRRIGIPVIQYEETDWEFLIRVASHFRTVVYPVCRAGSAAVCIGVEKGEIRQAEPGSILKWGIGDGYYRQGCYEAGKNRGDAVYLEAEGSPEWEIGDVIACEGALYTVFRKNVVFERGGIVCTYLLGRDSFIYRKRETNGNLRGARLKGTVRKADKESVYLQLDLDKEEKADYPWAWTPETGNLCYCMPEPGTEVMLYFPSGEEREGIALHALPKAGEDGACHNVQQREFHTLHDKRAGLYPGRLFLEGKDGAVSVGMEDGNGIRLDSGSSIVLEAAGNIFIDGKKCRSSAQAEVLFRTPRSNIEICRDFNFYAPEGVRTDGKDDGSIGDLPDGLEKKKTEHWQMSYSAMAAVPTVDIARCDEGSGLGMAACGAVPAIAGGRQILAMKDAMAGKKGKEARFQDSLQSMEIFTVKGGHAVWMEG